MDFPSRPPKAVKVTSDIFEALGKTPVEILAHRDLIAVYENQNDIKLIKPDFEKLKKGFHNIENLDFDSIEIIKL